MRVLTKYERDQFDIAFKHISALSAMQSDFTELFMLRHGHDSQAAIPSAYQSLSEVLGGFAKMKHKFCQLYRKEATEWLIKYCFDNRVQPSSFEIVGAVRQIHVEHKNYTEHQYKAQ